LEAQLLDKPEFCAAFDSVLEAWCGVPGWPALDALWKEKQARDVRYAILRGLLAERQGHFEDAARRYDESRSSDWGGFHRGRLLALVGRVDEALQELKQIADGSKDAALFKRSALGVGELLLLRDQAPVAEKYLSGLWDTRKELPMRLSLLEPLLTLRAERSAAGKWLETLKPVVKDPAAAPTGRQLDNGVLWMRGRLVMDPLAPLPGWGYATLMAPDSVRWLPQFALDPRTSIRFDPLEGKEPRSLTIFQYGESLSVTEGAGQTGNFTTWSAGEPLRESIKAVLRARPWIAGKLQMRTSEDAAYARAIHDFLDKEALPAERTPGERVLMLHLRSRAGAKASQLHDDALRLWRETRVDESYRQDLSHPTVREAAAMAPPFMLASMRLNASTGVDEPSPEVIWNLRGADFTAAAQAAFESSLVQVINKDADDRARSSVFSPRSTPPTMSQVPPSFSSVEDGLGVLAALWEYPDRFGLGDADLGEPGAAGSAMERIADVVVRAGTDKALTFAQQAQGLESVPTFWLLLLRYKVANSVMRDGAQRREQSATRLAAVYKRLDALVQSQQPGWLLHSLARRLPLTSPASVTDAQKDELLAGNRRSGVGLENSFAAVNAGMSVDDWWKSVDPSLADSRARELASMGARERLLLRKLPHPLWGLEWQPSLLRDAALAGTAPWAAPLDKPFLTSGLTGLVQSEREDRLPSFGSIGSPLSEAAAILRAGFGDAVLKPQLHRAGELRPLVPRFPFLADLLALWEVQEKPDARRAPPLMILEGSLQARHLAGMLPVLQKSASDRARVTLAVLNRNLGDREVAGRLAKSFESREGPLAAFPTKLPPLRSGIPSSRRPKTTEDLVADAKEFLGTGRPRNGNSVEGELSGIYRQKTEVMSGIYQWLKEQSKAEPDFAFRAGVMAELARKLQLPPAEIDDAEQLDLQLNAAQPEVWLRRGVSYAKRENGKWALDMFFEAVRRMDLSAEVSPVWSLSPPKSDWLDRVAAAGRMDELVAAYDEALQKSPPNQARNFAATVLTSILRSPDNDLRPARFERLFATIGERQPHLYLVAFPEISDRIAAFDRAGEGSAAQKLARGLLQSWWPENLDRRSGWGRWTNGYPAGLWDALCSWGQGVDDVRPDASILSLFRVALRGESGDFVRESLAMARQHPTDEQLVSCALVAQALVGTLPADSLRVADALPPEERMRVAWRLCVLAPAQSLPLAGLAPMLEEGIRSLFHNVRLPDAGSRSFVTALNVMPSLEKLGGGDALRRLLPGLLSALPDGRQWLPASRWEALVSMAARLNEVGALCELEANWQDVCGDLAFWPGSDQLSIETFAALAGTALHLGPKAGPPFARMASALWEAQWRLRGASSDPDPASTANVAAALLSVDDADELRRFAASLAEVVRFGSDPTLSTLLDRIRFAEDLLKGNESHLPSVFLHVEPSDDETKPATVRWKMGLPSPDVSASGPPGRFGLRQIDPSQALVNNAVLHALSGRFELEILAGESENTLRTLTRVSAAPASGSQVLADLPKAGVVRGVLRGARSGAVCLGPVAIFSLHKTLFDTASIAAAGIPQWREEWQGRFGRPVTGLVPVEEGVELLIRSGTPDADARAAGSYDGGRFKSVNLVALNAQKEPIGGWPVFPCMLNPVGLVVGEDGTMAALLRPSEWVGSGGGMRSRSPGDNVDGWEIPRYLVLAASGLDADALPPVQIRPFSTISSSATLPLLEHRFLATLGFDIKSWHVASRIPRAAFSGEGVLSVYDTSGIPWKKLLAIRSDEITAGCRPFIMQPDTLHFVVPASTKHPGPSCRVLKLAEATSLDDGQRIELPFSPNLVDLAPTEDAVVLASHRMNGSRTEVECAWLEPSGALLNTRFNRPYLRSPEAPRVAWWGKDGRSIALYQDELLLRLQRTENAFVLQDQKVARPSLASLPQGAIPGWALVKPAWLLKRPNVLARADPASGALLEGFRLKEDCVGRPVRLSGHDEVILQTKGRDIISVTPPPK